VSLPPGTRLGAYIVASRIGAVIIDGWRTAELTGCAAAVGSRDDATAAVSAVVIV